MKQYTESATINGQYFRNGSPTGWPVKTESMTLPSAGVAVVELDETIHPGSTIEATIAGAPAEVVPYSFTPAAGEVAVSRALGLAKYNQGADGGKTLALTYTPAGTRLTAGKLVAMEAQAPGASALEDLTDVEIDTPLNGQAVIWNSTEGKWINAMPGGGGGAGNWGSIGGVLSDQTDLQNALDDKAAANIALSDLSDVDVDSLLDGQMLVWNASEGKWNQQDQPEEQPLTDKGDLFTHDGSAIASLELSISGGVLSVNDSTPTGLEWTPTPERLFGTKWGSFTVNDGGSSQEPRICFTNGAYYIGYNDNAGEWQINFDQEDWSFFGTAYGTHGGTWAGNAIPVAKGGTGVSAVGTAGQVLATNGTADGTEWVDPPPKITSGTTAPTSPAVGDIWLDTN